MALENKLYNMLGLHGRPSTNLNFINGLICGWLRGYSRLISIYENYDDPDTNDISFTSLTGSLVNAISLGAEKTILHKLVIKEDQQGSKEFTLSLNEMPTIPLIKGTKVNFSVNGSNLFTGYIWRTPEPGTNEKGYFVFSGFGMKKRLEKQIIVENTLYNITDVNQSGLNTIYIIDSIFPTDIEVGQRVLVANCEERSNNVNALVTNITSNTLTVANNGISETPPNATLKVLPLEWSDGATLISDLFKQVITTYDNGATGISYSASRIETTSGVILGGQTGCDLNGMTIWKFIDTIRPSLLAQGYELGVDRDGYYFLKTRNQTTTDVKCIGFDANEFTIQTDIDGVINSVTVGRKRGMSEGGAGYSVAANAESLESIALYLRNHKKLEIPSYLPDEFALEYAESYVANNKDPKVSASIKGLDFDGAVEFANHDIAVNPFTTNRVLNIMDTFDGWSTDSAITRSLSSIVRVLGAASHKLEFDSDSGTLTHRLDFSPFIKAFSAQSFSFWIRSNKPGSVVRCAIWDGTAETIIETVIAEENVFQEVTYEVENYSGDIEWIEFRFDNTEDNTIIYLDLIQMVDFYSQRYTLPVEEVTYTLAPEGETTDIQYGQAFDRFDDMIAGVISQMENFKLLLRDN